MLECETSHTVGFADHVWDVRNQSPCRLGDTYVNVPFRTIVGQRCAQIKLPALRKSVGIVDRLETSTQQRI